MWDLPGPGIESVSATLAGGLFTTWEACSGLFWPMRHTDLTNTCWIMTVACNLATRWGRVLEEEARTKHHRRRESFHLVWPGRITWWVSRNFPDGYGQREFWEKKFAQVQRRMNQHTWDQVLEPWHQRTKRVFWGKWDPELSVRKTNVWKMQSEMHGDGSGRKSSCNVTVKIYQKDRGDRGKRGRENSGRRVVMRWLWWCREIRGDGRRAWTAEMRSR